MNKVIVTVDPPEDIWMRGKTDKDGRLVYEARFCRSGSANRPSHMGPIITLAVKTPEGRTIETRSTTLAIKSNGDFFLQQLQEAPSELERPKDEKRPKEERRGKDS